jgi:hypothetical protein
MVVVHAVRDKEIFAAAPTGFKRIHHRVAARAQVTHDIVVRGEFAQRLSRMIFLPRGIHVRRKQIRTPSRGTAHDRIHIRILEFVNERLNIRDAVGFVVSNDQQLVVKETFVLNSPRS